MLLFEKFITKLHKPYHPLVRMGVNLQDMVDELETLIILNDLPRLSILKSKVSSQVMNIYQELLPYMSDPTIKEKVTKDFKNAHQVLLSKNKRENVLFPYYMSCNLVQYLYWCLYDVSQGETLQKAMSDRSGVWITPLIGGEKG